MAENEVDINELTEYDSEEEQPNDGDGVTDKKQTEQKKSDDTYVAIHASGFREFILKPELLRAIGDCGFEHPSEGRKKLPMTTRLKSRLAPSHLLEHHLLLSPHNMSNFSYILIILKSK